LRAGLLGAYGMGVGGQKPSTFSSPESASQTHPVKNKDSIMLS
jgi:hypothetical protein